MSVLLSGMFRDLLRDVAACFSIKNLRWHLLAIVLTYVLVVSGFDWWYFTATRSLFIESLGLIPAVVGFVVPVVIPIWMYLAGRRRRNKKEMFAAGVVAQAELIGWLVSSVYKVFTGRLQPTLFTNGNVVDTTRDFHFGFLQHGIFWGWPSSHTTVAFAMAFALIALYPRDRVLRYGVLLYALAIGLGVSVTIHWFSDFAAGVIFGTLVGTVVAKRLLAYPVKPA